MKSRKKDSSPTIISDIYDGTIYRKKIQEGKLGDIFQISFSINVDGISPYENSSWSIWPIWGICNEFHVDDRYKQENIFLLGMWADTREPTMNTYMNPFVKLWQQSYKNYNLSLGTVDIKVGTIILNMILDLKAKSPIQNMKQHNAYFGCSFCKQPGEHTDHHYFPYKKTWGNYLRTHMDHLEIIQQLTEDPSKESIDGVKGWSVLLDIPDFDIIHCCVLEGMHCFWLNITDQFCSLWFNSKYHSKSWYLGKREVLETMDNIIGNIQIPYEITSNPKLISKRKKWKAYDMRNWCFYFSIPLLSGTLSPNYFQHWVIFVKIMLLSNTSTILKENLIEIQLLCEKFVLHSGKLYGSEEIKICIHQLLHLSSDLKMNGPIWTHNSFYFENMGKLLKQMHFTTGKISIDTVEQINSYQKIISKTFDSTNKDVNKLLSNLQGPQYVQR